MTQRIICLTILIVASLLMTSSKPVLSQRSFPRYCLEHRDQNLVKNCEFNEGLNHWTSYIEAGAVDITTIDGNECHTIHHPCGYMRSNGGFVAGLYQQIQVVPGGIYDANLQLLLYDSFDKADGAVQRKIGLDPTGGTDSRSPNIIWSPTVDNSLAVAGHKLVWEDLQIQATAQGPVMTVFIWVNNLARVSSPVHQFWIDEIGMIQIGQAEPTPVPTNTPIPPTSTPIPPTPTPIPTDTPLPTETATPLPTDTPTPTRTFTPTPTNTSTPTPIPTDTQTVTSEAMFVAEVPDSLNRDQTSFRSEPQEASPLLSGEILMWIQAIGGGLLCFGVAGMVFIVVIGGVLMWLYYLGKE